MTHTQCFFPLVMLTPTPHFVFYWPQFTPMHCPFFMGYSFMPTYCLCPDNHSVDFLLDRMNLSKHPLCSTTSAGQDDIPVLTLLVLSTAGYIYHNIRRPTTLAGYGDIPVLTLLIISTVGYVCQYHPPVQHVSRLQRYLQSALLVTRG